VFPGCFANGLPASESEGAALAAEQQPLAASALSESLTAAPAWQTIPSWDVVVDAGIGPGRLTGQFHLDKAIEEWPELASGSDQ
jgi:hypothetical protein